MASDMAALRQLEDEATWRENTSSIGDESMDQYNFQQEYSAPPPLPSDPPPKVIVWNDEDEDDNDIVYGDDDINDIDYNNVNDFKDAVDEDIYRSVNARRSPNWQEIDALDHMPTKQKNGVNYETQPAKRDNYEQQPIRYTDYETQPSRQAMYERQPTSNENNEIRPSRHHRNETQPVRLENYEQQPIRYTDYETQPSRQEMYERQPTSNEDNEIWPSRHHRDEKQPVSLDNYESNSIRYENSEIQPIRPAKNDKVSQWETYDGIPIPDVTAANKTTALNHMDNVDEEPIIPTFSRARQLELDVADWDVPAISVTQAEQSDFDVNELEQAGTRTPVLFRSDPVAVQTPDIEPVDIPSIPYEQAHLATLDKATAKNEVQCHTDLQESAESLSEFDSYEEEIPVMAYSHARSQHPEFDGQEALTQEVVAINVKDSRGSNLSEVFDSGRGSQDGDLNLALKTLHEDNQLALDLEADAVNWSGLPLDEVESDDWIEAERDDLQILGDIAALDEEGSSSDSDFDTAIRKTVEGTDRNAQPHRLVHPVSPLQAGPFPVVGDVDVGEDEIMYEIILEREDSHQPFGIITQTMRSPANEQEGLYIKSIIEGSPAHEGGIVQTGDRMLEINGQRVSGLSASQAQAVLNSPQHMCTVKVARHRNADNSSLSTGHVEGLQHPANSFHSPPSSPLPPPPLPQRLYSHSDSLPPAPRDAIHFTGEAISPPYARDDQGQEVESSNDTHSDVNSDVWDSGASDAIHHEERETRPDKADTLVLRPAGKPVFGLTDKAVEIGRRFGPPVSEGKLPGGVPQESSAASAAEITQSETEDDHDGRVKDIAEIESEPEIVKVELSRKPGIGFGFTVAGGIATGGCYIKQLVAAPNAQAGSLLPGDKILKVNDNDTTTMTHTQAVSLLRKGPNDVTLTLLRYPHAAGSQERLMLLKALAERGKEKDRSLESQGSDTGSGKPKSLAERENETDRSLASNPTNSLSSVSHAGPPAYRPKETTQQEFNEVRSQHFGNDAMPEVRPGQNNDDNVPDDQQVLDRRTGFSDKDRKDPVSSQEERSKQYEVRLETPAPDYSDSERVFSPLPDYQSSRHSPSPSSQLSQDQDSQLDHSDQEEEEEVKEKDSEVAFSDFLSHPIRRQAGDVPISVSQDWLSSLPLMTRPGTEDHANMASDILQSLVEMVETGEPLEEFKNLRQVKDSDKCQIGQLSENKLKNRYRNILPYDDNRVKLEGFHSDYINASYIDVQVGHHGTLEYVASQQPLPATMTDWWSMLWQLDTAVVVCLAGTKNQYTWMDQGSTMTLGQSGRLVRLLESQSLEEFDVYSLLQEEPATSVCKRVTILHYTAWPQPGTPDTALPILKLLRAMHVLSLGRRPVVYCSAGVGRTGVVLAIDMALAAIELGEQVDLFEIVSKLRKQRHGMIQTTEQYVFCYTACMEALLSLEMADE